MININLLKDLNENSNKFKKRKITVDVSGKAFVIKRIMLLFVPLLVAFVGGKVFTFFEKNEKIKHETILSDKKKELVEIEQKLKIIEGIIAETESIDEKLKDLKGVFDLRVVNTKVLDAIRAHIPDQVYLTRLEISTRDHTMNISGVADTNESITDFVDRLNKDPSFVAGSVLIGKVTGTARREFDISARSFKVENEST